LYRTVKDRLQPLDYNPKSQADLPPDERDKYRGVEVAQTIRGLVDGKPVCCKYRLLLLWSEAKARQEAATRQRHLDKIRAEFEHIEKNLNRYRLKTLADVQRRLEAAKRRYTEGKMFRFEVKEDRQGTLTLSWQIDAKELAHAAELDGVFVLKTNLAKATHSLSAVLRTHKEQIQVERRIGNLKGPLAVAPMFLKNPQRMAGLLFVLMWALMVLALIERQVRRRLQGKPMYGLYPERRPSKAPTGVRLIEAFEYLCVILIEEDGHIARYLGDLDDTQRQILKLLDMHAGHMKTFKHRCGT
jgi:transposase